MDIFNTVIVDTLGCLSPHSPTRLSVDQNPKWAMCDKNELILSQDAAFELGGSRLDSVSYSLVTSSSESLEDQIFLYGPDLPEIDCDVPFARIVLIKVKDCLESMNDKMGDLQGEVQAEDRLYKVIKDLEYAKYRIIPKGYMMRSSSFDKREQVRVSKEAIQEGLNFETLGSIYIQKLKQNSFVESLQIIFISKPLPEMNQLVELAAKSEAITKTLNHVLRDMDINCHSCNLKTICDEVEGLKELHFKKSK